LKQHIVGMVEPMWINALSDRMVTFANVSAYHIIRQQLENYVRIKNWELEANESSMKQPADITRPCENMVQHIEDGEDFADQVGTPFSEAQLIKIGYNIMHKIGVSMSAKIGTIAPL
jgi:hypothetical protein